jgi:hypothetical protein
MAVSKQWTEWHLTPCGWISGSTRRDVWRDEPEERVITFVYQEQVDKAHPEPHATVQESWRSKTSTQVEQLLAQHGPCPRKL